MNKLIAILLIASFILLVNCENTLKIYSEIDNIEDYIYTWQEIEGDSREIEYTERDKAEISILTLDDIILGNVEGVAYGDIYSGGCTIETINDPRVIQHEIGHCFAYADVDDRDSIMCYASYNSATNYISLVKK